MAEQPPALAASNTLFRDDFECQPGPGWTWQERGSARWKIVNGGWLRIRGEEQSILKGERQTNLLWTVLPPGDFEISIHLESRPLADSQRAGLLLYRDAGHYIALSRGYCSACVLGGSGVLLEYNLGGSRGRYAAATEGGDVYLRLVIERGAASAFYATRPGDWQHLASIPNQTVFRRGALNVTNGGAGQDGFELIASFDYFELSRSIPREPTPIPWPLLRAEGEV